MKKSLRTWTLAGFAWLAASLGAGAARADGGPKIRDSVWLPVGMSFGYSINPDPAPNGFLVGPELSLVYLDESAYWFGAYTDVLRDFGSDMTRLSLNTREVSPDGSNTCTIRPPSTTAPDG